MVHPMIPRRAALALPALLLAGQARAAWPDRPIRLIIPFAAGSGTDLLARLLNEPLSQRLGQRVVIENRPGGNGVIGAEAGATAAADGHTLVVMGTSASAMNPHLLRRLPYDPLKDYAFIGGIAEAPYLLVVAADHPARDLAALLALGRSRPEGLTFGSGNAGSLIMAMMIGQMANVPMTGVPYRGGAEVLADVVARRVDFNLADFGPGMAQQAAGRLRVLGVTTGQTFPLSPAVPPIANVVPGFDANIWFGLAAPAATPPAIVAQAGEALRAVLGDAEMREKLSRIGLVPMPLNPADFDAHVRREQRIWGERVRAAGIEPT